MDHSIVEESLRNPALFRGKKILVAGDIALDRTFFCDPAPGGRHATHAGESIVDVRPRGDDFGTVGAAHNATLLATALGAESLLVTVTGDDLEADRVAEVFGAARTRAKQIRLSGVQTVTRLRFFAQDAAAGRFRLLLRADKDPDGGLSYAGAEAQVCTPGFLDWWEHEVDSSDAVFFSDTDKGFLSRRILLDLDQRIRRASERRVSRGEKPITVVVDPKREWEKYAGLKVDLFKPNDVEASGAVHLPRQDWSVDANLVVLAERLSQKYGDHFPRTVITLGEHGAALIAVGEKRASLARFSAIPAREPAAGIAMHCGDMFGSALALSFCVDNDAASAIPFANYVASLQVSKPIGQKITRADFADPANIKHILSFSSLPRLVAEFDMEPERPKAKA